MREGEEREQGREGKRDSVLLEIQAQVIVLKGDFKNGGLTNGHCQQSSFSMAGLLTSTEV